jgi:exo beta-1,2-glucooligosaccharide sophorohydrolase (non-reducing end)
VESYGTLRSLPLINLKGSVKIFCLLLLAFEIAGAARGQDSLPPAMPQDLQAASRQLAVALQWKPVAGVSGYEIQRGRTLMGPYQTLDNKFEQLTMFNDFIGVGGTNFYYRVRSYKNDSKNRILLSDWSNLAEGHSDALETNQLLTEMQKAGFDYFYEFGHPVCGLARLSMRRDPDICATGASGMGFFNLGVGIERGFITRQQGVDRTLLELKFLSQHAQRFHGAFPHLLNGQTGNAIPFSRYDDGADIVETAFLMEGILFAREYFSGSDTNEVQIRSLADNLWRSVEWDWFLKNEPYPVLIWHWSPNWGWKIDLHVTGFNECQIIYLLAMASPTHPIKPTAYWEGWEGPQYGVDRIAYGIRLSLGDSDAPTPPLFMAHYSYMGLDPRQISYRDKTYFDHFRDFCLVQARYAWGKSDVYKGYGPLWGITASSGPDGYSAFQPGKRDNGTLAPTAALSSMPYVPKESLQCLLEMYRNNGPQLWGPLGFYDSFNPTRKWVSKTYLCIDQGPIAPMIENYRTGLCWKIFMKCPEIQPVIDLINAGEAAHIHVE